MPGLSGNALTGRPDDPPGQPAVRLLIATTNPAKADRLRRAVAGWPFEALLPSGLPGSGPPPPPAESGASHLEIAVNKARAWSERTGILSIASDGGLAVPALGNAWDSLTTRRSAGGDADDAQRLRRLIDLMEPHEGESRRASWTEAVASPAARKQSARGRSRALRATSLAPPPRPESKASGPPPVVLPAVRQGLHRALPGATRGCRRSLGPARQRRPDWLRSGGVGRARRSAERLGPARLRGPSSSPGRRAPARR